ncbi:crotonase/enoyl-CoA hydratase family protein [Mycobacterium sp. NAZ190054]|uniref:crotonase/enoyl-CoA hydratase family protein n=1 Tax=Mycobacterium sp. NAZ190054 TaxID=1747766 RepID=UPI0007942A2F|nr:crotonase/enoyl-CoA hydratase family protein [Mycobacterium sp. NAZ190054]KWX58524.1 enoyl-CoA hydratase [Mycobacterium sp. NAZ190054]
MSAVLFDVAGCVGIITLNRPEKRNAVNQEVAEGVEAYLDDIEQRSDIFAAVLAGNGPVFSAGADLNEVSAGNGDALHTERGGFAGIVQRDRTKPIIAAVEGPALAGGCEIVLACDLTVASERASFGLPEVKRALVAGGGGMIRLPRILPPAVAMEMVLTGDPMRAQRAYELGMVNHLVSPGQTIDQAMYLAERISENGPLAVAKSRQVVLASVQSSESVLWQLSDEARRQIMASEDFKEGPRAFLERRAPVWKGC